MHHPRGLRVAAAVSASALMLLVGCSPAKLGPRPLTAIKKRGTLVVLTRNGPTTYYRGRDGKPAGPEYQMVLAFAKSIGVSPKFVLMGSTSKLLHALARGRGDMIAAGITRTPRREKHFAFGPSYQKVTQKVVCRRGGPRPKTIKQLTAVKLKVIAESSYVERLRALARAHPKLEWKTTNSKNTQALLQNVWAGKLACTVVDSDIAAINRRYFPDLVSPLTISKPQPLAWVVSKKHSEALREAMRRWLRHYRASGSLRALMERYYGHVNIFNYAGLRDFHRKTKRLWPRYRGLFYSAARKYGLPPLVLAAAAFQESHWNPRATSPTGVRGMMMLTLNTAKTMGVKNRFSAGQSIRGGARYLAHLEKKLSDSIRPDDRIWFALAAYNIGLYHLHDARTLAKKLGKNPNTWHSISRVLPLLAEKRYYRHLHYGYARGLAPVRYVRRVRNYADILRMKTGRR